ncbi:unnamed protein product [Aureobasidium uvarum]|uniref:Uncharacterized protein n=1 Tax=Aureobasidium uvarum TaxID=2773716 RepID=A0A9N8KRP5_9PEZI|nr:unnamed protein product [Aureobasidium uvarum]
MSPDKADKAKRATTKRTEFTKRQNESCVPSNSTDGEHVDKDAQQVQKLSMHEQIANVMKLAGALYEVSTMLNEEISNATSRTDASLALDHIDQSLLNEPNPVFETIQNDEIDIDAIRKAMSDLKTRLHSHQDKANILAHLCKRWKSELEDYYPLMNRMTRSRNATDSLALPRSGESTIKSPVVKKKVPTKPQKHSSTRMTRNTRDRAEAVEPEFVEPELAKKPWSPAKLRYKDEDSTFSRNPRQDEPPSTRQDELMRKKRPYNRSSDHGKGGDDKDDGFSIFAI